MVDTRLDKGASRHSSMVVCNGGGPYSNTTLTNQVVIVTRHKSSPCYPFAGRAQVLPRQQHRQSLCFMVIQEALKLPVKLYLAKGLSPRLASDVQISNLRHLQVRQQNSTFRNGSSWSSRSKPSAHSMGDGESLPANSNLIDIKSIIWLKWPDELAPTARRRRTPGASHLAPFRWTGHSECRA